jgi:molybdopterin synthase sulfur carrier subunit
MIKLWLHSTIVNHTEARAEWKIQAAPLALREALETAFAENKYLRQSVVDETGNIREHINIFVGHKNARRLNGLDTLVQDGEDISVFPSVSGG